MRKCARLSNWDDNDMIFWTSIRQSTQSLDEPISIWINFNASWRKYFVEKQECASAAPQRFVQQFWRK